MRAIRSALVPVLALLAAAVAADEPIRLSEPVAASAHWEDFGAPLPDGEARTLAAVVASAAALAAAHKEKLAVAVEQHGVGREVIDQWEVRLVARQTGSQVGHFDPQYVSPDGKRFRSRAEALRHLGLQESKPKIPK